MIDLSTIDMHPGNLIRFTSNRDARQLPSVGALALLRKKFTSNTIGIVVSVASVIDEQSHQSFRYAYVIASDGSIGWLRLDRVFEETLQCLV